MPIESVLQQQPVEKKLPGGDQTDRPVAERLLSDATSTKKPTLDSPSVQRPEASKELEQSRILPKVTVPELKFDKCQRSEKEAENQFVSLEKEKKKLPELTDKEKKTVTDDLNNGKWSKEGKEALQRVVNEYMKTEKGAAKIFKFMNDIGAEFNDQKPQPKNEMMKAFHLNKDGGDLWFAMLDRDKKNRPAEAKQIGKDIVAGKEGPKQFKVVTLKDKTEREV